MKSPGWAKEVDKHIFRPSRAPSAPFFSRGSLRSPLAIVFRASGAGPALLPAVLSFETVSSAPTLDAV
jgi:hypothetical protein